MLAVRESSLQHIHTVHVHSQPLGSVSLLVSAMHELELPSPCVTCMVAHADAAGAGVNVSVHHVLNIWR